MMLLKYRKYKKVLIYTADVLIIFLAFVFSNLLLREWSVPLADKGTFLLYVVVIPLMYVLVFHTIGLYQSLWTVAGYYDYKNVVLANVLAGVILLVLNFAVMKGTLSFAAIVMASMMILLGTLAVRMYFRIYRRLLLEKMPKHREELPGIKKVLIIGAGQAAAMILKEIRHHQELMMHVVGLVDDSDYKQGSRIAGFKVLGRTKDLPKLVEEFEVDEILFAIPSLPHEERRHVLEVAKTTKAKLKTLPGIYEMVDKGINLSSIRDVEISDLLGRKEIKLNNDKIAEYISGKTVLVTGGGGSIGSELCRQIASLSPKKLIILDIYENNAYEIENELKRKYPDLNLLTLIASVRDQKKIDRIFKKEKPETVFHAAAHKHVPLMETSPEEAIKNNVFGTLHVALAARNFGAERFILISTDKAVNPTNIMGASKRLCEMIVQTLDADSEETDFVAVRFGNVLGSNGSVIPLFKEQIKNGGPVTLTHKEIVRYFMTIPEAVQLVLQAGSYAQGGEIFVLDMGDPVKIYDLAENLIRLSGYEPHTDIEIKITGLRPGEKLYEELLMAEEGLEKTPNDLIYIGRPNGFDKESLKETLMMLKEKVQDEEVSSKMVKELVGSIVKTYTPDLR
ncbi:nucleoside-diphosphate sugar epimerase/dehydratase [Proteiniclasticum sp.]|uniref:nucleoside-diphosphate sugar epimerase/dehydratase n=1 Tax=Proteiniclasticum sp. TaxID=2053595 RepID=UPI00289EC05C|nr:nucleoside-diphosphate sugar epimerase/dehydratase [Proteiniclasticum sp.]